jgi:PST family polysaccharide transporter
MKPYFDDNKLREGLGRQSVRGGAISIIARAVNAAVQVGSILILARLLAPEDYGLVAMVAAVTGFAPVLVDLGTRDAVVQRAGITEGEVSALFWVTLGVGLTCTLAISAGGSLIAAFYNEPRLAGIAAVSSISFVGVALTAQHQALLRRAVMFREIAVIDIVANALSVVGSVVMAYAGLGYWALVVRPVATHLLVAAGTWWYCGWLPGRPRMTSGVKQMLKFGVNLCGFTLTDFIGRNGDRVAVGRGLGSRTLGFYQNALLVYDNLLDVLVFPLHSVAVSSLSRLQGDLPELRRSWAKALSTAVFFAMPAFGVLAITSADLIGFLLGEKWVFAGALLSVLALRGIPHSVERTLGWLHVAAGRTDRWMRWGVLATGVQIAALLCGLPFGPFGIVWAHVVSMYILFVPALAYAGQPLGIGARDVVSAVGAPLTGALVSTAAGFAVRSAVLGEIPPIERMALLVVLYMVVYLAVVVGLFRMILPLQVVLSLLGDFLPRPLQTVRATIESRLPAARNR